MRVYTIGHSRRSIDDLIALLRDAGVEMLLDVRATPHSRFNPQFNAEHLATVLRSRGFLYRHLRDLGGRREHQVLGFPSPNGAWKEEAFHNYADYALTPAFRSALDELTEFARRHVSAIMCAEARWQECHRQIIADYLIVRHIPVTHLIGPGEEEPGHLTPEAVPQDDLSVHYPPSQGSLF